MDYVDKLTGLREDNDLTQTDIAKILNVRQTAISKYEKRQCRYQVEDIKKLCEYYHVSADWLLDIKPPAGGKITRSVTAER